ncbi:MAG TPA: hypothetical protein VFU17_07415 [Candidatus Limnocylindrales bacterium]|nr:hypothetical protein [Candidatus Limnocylindrales bacterium]
MTVTASERERGGGLPGRLDSRSVHPTTVSTIERPPLPIPGRSSIDVTPDVTPGG